MAKAPSKSVPHIDTARQQLINADAPIVFFDHAPSFGIVGGVGHIALEATRIYGHNEMGNAQMDRVVVVHLKGSFSALLALRTAIDGVLALAQGKPDAPAN